MEEVGFSSIWCIKAVIMIEGIFVEGLIFSVMALGILISYRILDIADLTCDGSVATGAAVWTLRI